MPEESTKEEIFLDIALNVATEDSTSAFGHLVSDFSESTVELGPWPQRGMRVILHGQHPDDPLHTERDITVRCRGSLIHAVDPKFGNGGEIVAGQMATTHKLDSDTHAKAGSVRRQPESGTVYFPKSNMPFILLLAPANDKVSPSDFQAFYFLGDQGFHVAPGVWHQYPYPVNARTSTFVVKESKVYTSEVSGFSAELGQEMRFPVNHSHIQALLGSDVIPDLPAEEAASNGNDSSGDEQMAYDLVGAATSQGSTVASGSNQLTPAEGADKQPSVDDSEENKDGATDMTSSGIADNQDTHVRGDIESEKL